MFAWYVGLQRPILTYRIFLLVIKSVSVFVRLSLRIVPATGPTCWDGICHL